jgi:thioredoxin 1
MMTEIVPELTNGEFEAFSKEGTVLIDFFAEWCMPCMMMSPIIEDLNEEFNNKINIGKINVEDNQKIAEKFEVNSIPTFIILKNGKEVERMNGALTQDELEDLIKRHI